MTKQNGLVLIVALLAFLQGCVVSADELRPQEKRLDNIEPKRILFVGNSYLYYNDSVHNHVRRIAEENGPHEPGAYRYKSATIGGARLSHHAIDSLLQPGRLGIDAPFELVILQGGSAEPLSPANRETFATNAADMARKIRSTGAEVALYMTHAYVEPHERAEPDMIDKIRETYVTTGNDLGALVIPVGLAFELAYARRPDIELHMAFDGTHPNMLGTYLAASVVYASIYQRSVADVDYNYFGEVSEADADFLRKIADEAVALFFD